MVQGSFFDRLVLDNAVSQWLTALGVIVAVILALKIASRILIRRLERLSNSTKTDLDDLLTELLKKTKVLFILLLAVWIGSLYLDFSPEIDIWIRRFLVVGLLVQGAFWGTAFVNYLLERHRKRRVEEDPSLATALGAIGIFARLVVWSIFLLLILQNLGVEITALLAGLGVGGIAVALAVQNVLGDLLASLSIVLDKPFVLGDFIIIGEFQGTVEHVGLKTTRIRSLSGEQLVFSNSDLLSSRIRNYKRMQERRAVFSIGVTYDTGYQNLQRIPEMIRGIVEGQALTRFDRSHFKGFGDFSLNFETVYYMLVPDYDTYMNVQEAVNLDLYRRFEEEGIEFAFPTQTLLLEEVPNRAES
ncbi:mechanosensitive ion channel family protein [Gemmatimonadota bacterium]